MTFYITNIDWVTNLSKTRQDLLRLPEDVVVQSYALSAVDLNDDEQIAEALSEYLTNLYGFQVNGFIFVDETEVTGGEKL